MALANPGQAGARGDLQGALVKKVREEFADTMLEVGQKDPRLVVLVGDISHGILQPFARDR